MDVLETAQVRKDERLVIHQTWLLSLIILDIAVWITSVILVDSHFFNICYNRCTYCIIDITNRDGTVIVPFKQ